MLLGVEQNGNPLIASKFCTERFLSSISCRRVAFETSNIPDCNEAFSDPLCFMLNVARSIFIPNFFRGC